MTTDPGFVQHRPALLGRSPSVQRFYISSSIRNPPLPSHRHHYPPTIPNINLPSCIMANKPQLRPSVIATRAQHLRRIDIYIGPRASITGASLQRYEDFTISYCCDFWKLIQVYGGPILVEDLQLGWCCGMVVVVLERNQRCGLDSRWRNGRDFFLGRDSSMIVR